MNLKVTTAANPKRQSLTQSNHPNAKPKPASNARNNNQKTHPARESTRVRRIEKIGSFFKTTLLVTESAKNVKEKRETPIIKLPIKGKRAKAARLTPTIHVAATARSDLLNDGRVNMEE